MNPLSALTVRGRYMLACHETADLISPSCDDRLAKEVFEAQLSRLAGRTTNGGWDADYLDKLFRFPYGMSFSKKIHQVVIRTPEYKDLKVKTTSSSETKKVPLRPVQTDPELLALSKTLPRRPGYVTFVSEPRYVVGRGRLFRERGVILFVRESNGTGCREFPLTCNYQVLKNRPEHKGWVPKWFVPAGTGRVLLRVKRFEYAAMPVGEFPAQVLTDEEHKRLKPGMYKECDPNLQVHAWPHFNHEEALRNLELPGDAPFDIAARNDPKTLPVKTDPFPFEVGDWVYVPLNGGELQVKAQIQATTCDSDPSCCVVRIEAFVVEDASGKRLLTPSWDMNFLKKLITQRAFPPIPYESKREIGTSDVPGGYLNLDWE